MKLIDHTPYLTANGEVSFTNQILAAMKYGYSWYPEIKAQQVVIDNLNSNLTKGYTLLRNITLPGSNATIPLILVGPAGIFVIVVTHLKGTYQAKGDNWEVLEGGKNRQTRSNLLVITSRMARAIQRYLNKQGLELASVDGILISTDPGMHIESVRPIVRVVMRDAIEHFVVSINHSGTTLTTNKSQTIVSMLTEPESHLPSESVNTQQPLSKIPEAQPENGSAPVPKLSEVLPWSGEDLGFEFKEDPTQELDRPFSYEPEPYTDLVPVPQQRQSDSKQFYFDKKQWILLICFGVVEIIILLVFFWLVYSNS
ncbi:MAG: hypothetical protein A2X25_05865 [Chloroflexi bacterium GWB2_49_20]|nr:MAG: hypothetical protein A2X25_05865 [Chloroflexi bacterium GWB2_49_20]OGN77148.1 MAG: hypothetical protein A2X26_06865 [Chloroflexi bacterium GWC2_49_37]OGN83874.1 MAG: hypothetical protein A2X27_02470 [Chloroflexi bacterium GWD2_49_16]